MSGLADFSQMLVEQLAHCCGKINAIF